MKNFPLKSVIADLQQLCNRLGYTAVETPLYDQMKQAYGTKSMSAWSRQQKAASARATKAAQTRAGNQKNRALSAANGPTATAPTNTRRQAQRKSRPIAQTQAPTPQLTAPRQQRRQTQGIARH